MATKKAESFEKNIVKLEEIVSKMEDDDLDLDKSIDLYKKGITLSISLSKSLKEYEDEIYVLKKDLENTLYLDKSEIE